MASQSSAQPGKGPEEPLQGFPMERWSRQHSFVLYPCATLSNVTLLENTHHPLTTASRNRCALPYGSNTSQNVKHAQRLKEGEGNRQQLPEAARGNRISRMQSCVANSFHQTASLRSQDHKGTVCNHTYERASFEGVYGDLRQMRTEAAQATQSCIYTHILNSG